MTVTELWEEYMETRSKEVRNKIVKEYINFVGYLAGRVISQLPPGIEKEDLIQFGVIGLINAIEKFDPSLGAKFETYAVRRIQGEIIDQIRHYGKSNGGLSRSLIQKQKKIEQAMDELEQKFSRQPTVKEIADYLGYTMDEYHKILSMIGVGNPVSLDRMVGFDDNLPAMEVIKDEDSVVPEEKVMKDEYKTILERTVNELPEKERIIVMLYYYEGWTLKEIGKYLNLSEPRISQLHTQSMIRLRGKLAREE